MESKIEVASKNRKTSALKEAGLDGSLYQISDLPNEILNNIFQYLTFSDLKCVSRVCKHWFDIVDSIKVFQNGNLKINKINYQQILEVSTLDRLISRNKYKNISIESVPTEVTTKIIKMGGAYINLLSITKSLTLKDLQSLCLNLSNLETLKIHHPIPVEKEAEHENYELLDFNSLTNLRKIELITCVEHEQPFIGHFKSFKHPLESVTLIGPEYEILNLLERHSSSLKKVYVEWLDGFLDSKKKYIEVFSKMNCLEDLGFSSNERYIELLDALEEVLKRGKLGCLKKLTLNILYPDLYENCDKLIDILKYCKDLEELQIVSIEEIDEAAISSISQISKLRYLCLQLNPISDIPNEAIFKAVGSVDRTCLHELVLGVSIFTEDEICTLAKNAPNLRVLDLFECKGGITDRSLQEIYRYLIKLRLLGLKCPLKSVTDKGISGITGRFSIERLKGLNTLKLNGANRLLSEAVFEVHLPELRNLMLFECGLTKNIIDTLVKRFSILEKLECFLCTYDEQIDEIRYKCEICGTLRQRGLKRLQVANL